MGRALTTPALLAASIALCVSGCGGSDSSTLARVVDHNSRATKERPSHSVQIDDNDPALRMFCHPNHSPAARSAARHALMLEIRSSPGAPADLNAADLAHSRKALCAGPPKRVTAP
jgi:hypothetical protein